MFPGYTVLRFEDILGGAAGEVEAQAAAQWLDSGAPSQSLPTDLVARDESGFDTRVIDKDTHKRKRRVSSQTVVGTQPKQLKRTAAAKGEQSKRGRPKRKQGQQAGSGGGKQASQYEVNLYSRAAYVSHGDGIGALSRRRARGPRPPSSRAGDLPPGWRMMVKTLHRGQRAGTKYKVYVHEASGKSFPTLAQAQAYWQGEGQAAPGAAAAAAAAAHELPPGWELVWVHAGEGEAGEEQQAALYVSPEGMVFEEWEEVESWLETEGQSCPPPELLLPALRRAAVGDYDAPAAAAGPRAHVALPLLGLQRARVALFQGERSRMERQLAAAARAPAAELAGGTAAGGTGAGGKKAAGKGRPRKVPAVSAAAAEAGDAGGDESAAAGEAKPAAAPATAAAAQPQAGDEGTAGAALASSGAAAALSPNLAAAPIAEGAVTQQAAQGGASGQVVDVIDCT